MATIETTTPKEKQPGQRAHSPWHMPWAAWKQVLIRAWRDAGQDNISLVAAGVAYYGFLALVPMLGAVVLSYGLFADVSTVVDNMHAITNVMPADAAKLIGDQLVNVVETSSGKKGLGLAFALALALYGALSGANAIVTALNIAYEEKEERGIFRVYGLALTITVATVSVAILAIVAIAALAALEKLFPSTPEAVIVLGKVLTYLLVVLAGAAGAATLYRYGPDRRKAKWVWITPGSLAAAALWLLLTLAFGLYVARFGNYNATYGSLGAVIVLLTWLYLSSYILLMGAEVNSEFERQTTRDTTEVPPMPIGQRGAAVADDMARGTEEEKADAPPQPPSDKPDDPRSTPPRSTPPRTARQAPLQRRSAPRSAPASGPAADYVSARVAQRLGRVAGAEKVAIAPALLVTAGLSLLRREGRGRTGAALLLGGGVWAWLQRRPAEASVGREAKDTE